MPFVTYFYHTNRKAKYDKNMADFITIASGFYKSKSARNDSIISFSFAEGDLECGSLDSDTAIARI